MKRKIYSLSTLLILIITLFLIAAKINIIKAQYPSSFQYPSPTPGIRKNGDANNDGKVDGVDFTIWYNHYGYFGEMKEDYGDFNGSGKVDGVDFVIWLTNYALQ